jgi:starch-binding outer membrane protein, SusD/RagB family
LAADFEEVFADAETSEDIFNIPFTPTEAHFLGWYYRAKGYGGRYEVAPTCALVRAFDSSVNCALTDFMAGWSPTDDRAAFSIGVNETSNEPFGAKYLSGNGDEDLHAIRFAEVILNRAEALARLNRLGEAVTEYNKTRVRAGLAPHVLGTHVTTQQQVLEAIWEERRLELAFEGFRWPDLVRTGRAVEVVGLQNRPHQVLYPIPQAERDVTTPPLAQNPGY